jgi:hypothetical protein
MKTEPVQDAMQEERLVRPKAGIAMTVSACVTAALVPGLGHALLRKWDRAMVFFACIIAMFALGLRLDGRIFAPDFQSLFPIMKFLAEAGSGLLYWFSFVQGYGVGDPTAYTYDYANVYLYVAGLLNMLVIIDAFDIAMGRKP